ncbi:monooxygenase [Seminavis robusta]|uniref:Monooxygenase n=1 Tax=Seminavis robusta TaxID=568900 RepID=A0A9N8EZS7_9STRA|nr:monooxygenase [Seminavis robusta]|eukprot:Sro2469_g328600.1 monooxygenase (848) ;mRNA; r:3248-5791
MLICNLRSHATGGRRWITRTSSLVASASRCGSTVATQHPFVLPNRDESVLLGCVSYDPAVGSIWSMMRHYLRSAGGVPGFDFVLFSNYEQQVRALLDQDIDMAWNGPLAHVLCEAHAKEPIVSLGMRDVDCDFESIVVVTKESGIKSQQELQGAQLLSGAQDSPQAHVIPLFHLQSNQKLEVSVQAQNEDIGKHGDTALGEVKALEALASDDNQFQGAILSRMMWDRAIHGQLDSVKADRLLKNASVLEDVSIPKFDHCQFDALLSTTESCKLDSFYKGLHGMDMSDPAQEPVMKLEGIRRSWAKPRQEGYDIVRAAIGKMGLTAKRAQNFVPTGARTFSTTTSTAKHSDRLEPGKRIGVIGCGVAGLQVIRSMRARGYDVTAFDKANEVGGLWRENYANFGLQVPKQLYELPDLEMEEAKWGEVASGPQVQAYIKRFADKFDLNRAVELNTAIETVSSNADGTWVFQTDTGKEHAFDYCVVSTGMYSTYPFVPEVPNKDAFEGSAIHSSEFRHAESAKGKRVVVIGGGKSATDCATSAANAGAESVTMIQRRAHWPTPLHIAGLIPFHHVFLSRLGQALVEAKAGVYPGSKSIASMFNPVMGPIFALVEQIFAMQFGMKGGLRPKAGVVEDFYGFAAVQDGTFTRLRSAGRVDVKLGEIESFTPEGVRLNGEDIEADKVIFATGFTKDYSRIFEADIVKGLDAQKDGLYLYKRMLPPQVPHLAFVGSEAATIFNCTASGLQAEWLARTLAGETNADLSEEAIALEVSAFRDFARSWMPSTSARSGLVLLHQIHYYDQLLEDMGEDPARKSNPISEYLGCYYGKEYNGIVGQPSRLPVGGADTATAA